MVTTRKARPSLLAIWVNGVLAGTWWLQAGEHRFQYAEGWIDSAAGRRLSLSLPITPGNAPHRGAVVQHYFDNLLPDSEATIRRRLQDRFATASVQPFDLLAAIGRDCVGAVQILPPRRCAERFRPDPGHPRWTKRASNTSSPMLWRPVGCWGRRTTRGSASRSPVPRRRRHCSISTGSGWHHWAPHPPRTSSKLPLGLVGNMRADMQTSV